MRAGPLTSVSGSFSSVDRFLGIFPIALKNNFDAPSQQVHTDQRVEI